MSRRSVTTVVVGVKLRLPVGVSSKDLVNYIDLAIQQRKDSLNPGLPIASLDTDSMLVKLSHKEIVYL